MMTCQWKNSPKCGKFLASIIKMNPELSSDTVACGEKFLFASENVGLPDVDPFRSLFVLSDGDVNQWPRSFVSFFQFNVLHFLAAGCPSNENLTLKIVRY